MLWVVFYCTQSALRSSLPGNDLLFIGLVGCGECHLKHEWTVAQRTADQDQLGDAQAASAEGFTGQ